MRGGDTLPPTRESGRRVKREKPSKQNESTHTHKSKTGFTAAVAHTRTHTHKERGGKKGGRSLLSAQRCSWRGEDTKDARASTQTYTPACTAQGLTRSVTLKAKKKRKTQNPKKKRKKKSRGGRKREVARRGVGEQHEDLAYCRGAGDKAKSQAEVKQMKTKRNERREGRAVIHTHTQWGETVGSMSTLPKAKTHTHTHTHKPRRAASRRGK